MPSRSLVFSAESVTNGHSDKLCDLIVDTILDNVLEQDRFARADLCATAAPGLVLVSGQLSTKGYVDITGTVRGVLKNAGYNDPNLHFCAQSIAVLNILQEQSKEVALTVDKRGAGNQGITIGYATNETKSVGIDTNLMPLPIFTAHSLVHRVTQARENNEVEGLHPDGQVQVTFLYEDGIPTKLLNATVSAHHGQEIEINRFREAIMEVVMKPVIASLGEVKTDEAELLVNFAGPFTLGGPETDVGMNGRTTVTDLYGTAVPCGGKALSGKDPTKTDRASTYMARHVAKSIVAADLADRCEVRLAYLFGREEPLSIQVNTFNTAKMGSDKDIATAIRAVFDTTTAGIVEHLDLWNVRYAPICCFGHVGRSDVPWEEVTHTEELKTALEKAIKG